MIPARTPTYPPAVPVDVASTRVVTRKPKVKKSMAQALTGAEAIVRAQPERLAGGEGGLDEVAAMAALRDLADQAVTTMVVQLLNEGAVSFRDVADALGITRQAVARKYRGMSSHQPGGQTANLR